MFSLNRLRETNGILLGCRAGCGAVALQLKACLEDREGILSSTLHLFY